MDNFFTQTYHFSVIDAFRSVGMQYLKAAIYANKSGFLLKEVIFLVSLNTRVQYCLEILLGFAPINNLKNMKEMPAVNILKKK
jgi:hypothetical protein